MAVESRREQRAALSAALRRDGCTWEDVAEEFRRRERCSPLLALRWAHGRSQQRTADAYNQLLTDDPGDKPINFRTVHRWEQWPEGGTEPPLAVLNRLARVYQVRASFLFDGEDHRHLDEAYQPQAGGDPIRAELLPAPGAPVHLARFSPRPPGVRDDGPTHDGLSPSPLVIVLHGRNPMERRAVLAAIASLPGVALLPDAEAGGSLLDPEARDVISHAIQRPESVGPEILAPLDALIMGFRHLDDTLGARYVATPVAGVLQLFGDLLPAAQPSIRQPLFSLAASAAQLAGWIAIDGGDSTQARTLYDRALEWATAADDTALTAYVWCCRSTQAWADHDALGAVSAIEAARRIAARQDPKLRSWIEAKAGRAYALAGNLDETVRAGNQAAELFDASTPGTAPTWLYHFKAEYLVSNHGSALTEVGRGAEAAGLLGQALERLSPNLIRDRGSMLAYQANAFGVAGEIQQACVVGAEAVLIGRQTGSGLTIGKVERLFRCFDGQTAKHPEVRALGDLLHEPA